MAKKSVKYCVVDAFTDSAFKGNPAAVCLLEEERDEEWLQAVAREFNLSETCYLTRLPEPAQSTIGSVSRFGLRWFTPVAEVRLCGHATLAASHILFAHGFVTSDTIEFSTLSGILTAKRVPDSSNRNASDSFLIELDFPVVPVIESNGAANVSTVSKSLNGASVNEILKTTTKDEEDFLVRIYFSSVVLPSGEAVVEAEPNLEEIQKFPGLIITGLAPTGSGFDIFSRYFAPKFGINEDPVTGSAHCALAAYWSKKLGKCDLIAYQASPRSGVLNLHIDVKNQRVLLRGKAIAVMEGSLLV
ncbi:phenazine biosynthesis-like domain-containing protein 1 [Phtheirospermum japonicum]|uniref:Phenazine biosynthesis-like domain-containing protein 1 n=1 Tax=Phtheirospermum japonicum TaxID=374723 RepID=A0A830CKQ2_9LAMI|nr:phenazine biosynthesis-like domain-containing protein 1 [Phtheirospermum japonicum]